VVVPRKTCLVTRQSSFVPSQITQISRDDPEISIQKEKLPQEGQFCIYFFRFLFKWLFNAKYRMAFAKSNVATTMVMIVQKLVMPYSLA
jgi:hypothetical protein